jgi:hypothetical protein
MALRGVFAVVSQLRIKPLVQSGSVVEEITE